MLPEAATYAARRVSRYFDLHLWSRVRSRRRLALTLSKTRCMIYCQVVNHRRSMSLCNSKFLVEDYRTQLPQLHQELQRNTCWALIADRLPFRFPAPLKNLKTQTSDRQVSDTTNLRPMVPKPPTALVPFIINSIVGEGGSRTPKIYGMREWKKSVLVQFLNCLVNSEAWEAWEAEIKLLTLSSSCCRCI